MIFFQIFYLKLTLSNFIINFSNLLKISNLDIFILSILNLILIFTTSHKLKFFDIQMKNFP